MTKVFIGVFITNAKDGYYPSAWKLVKTFNVWSDAEEYAIKYCGYPESDCIIQLTTRRV